MTDSPISRKLMSDTGSQLVAKVVGAAAGVVSVLLMTRHLGVRGYGTYSAALGFLALVSTVVNGGLPIMNVKRLAAESDSATRSFLGNQLRGRLYASVVVCGAALALAGAVFQHERVVIVAVALVLPGIPALAWASTLASALQARSLLRRVAFIESLCRCLVAGGFALATLFNSGLDVYLGVAVAAWFVQVLALGLALPAAIRPTLAGTGPSIASMYRSSGALGVAAVINVIYFRVDAVMVASLRGVVAAGSYAVAYRLLDLALLLPATFGGTVLPVLIRNAEDPVALHRLVNASLRLTVALMTPFVVAGIVFAGPAMSIVGGRGFAASANVLRILLVAGWFSSVDIMLGLLIVAAGLQGRMLWLNVGALTVNVLGNLILIPRFGGAGAALMTAACECVVMIVALAVLRSTIGFRLRLALPPRVLQRTSASLP